MTKNMNDPYYQIPTAFSLEDMHTIKHALEQDERLYALVNMPTAVQARRDIIAKIDIAIKRWIND